MPIEQVLVCPETSEYAFSIVGPDETLDKNVTDEWKHLPAAFQNILNNTSISLIDDPNPAKRRVLITTSDLLTQVLTQESRTNRITELQIPFLRTSLEIFQPDQNVVLSADGITPLITIRVQGNK